MRVNVLFLDSHGNTGCLQIVSLTITRNLISSCLEPLNNYRNLTLCFFSLLHGKYSNPLSFVRIRCQTAPTCAMYPARLYWNPAVLAKFLRQWKETCLGREHKQATAIGRSGWRRRKTFCSVATSISCISFTSFPMFCSSVDASVFLSLDPLETV